MLSYKKISFIFPYLVTQFLLLLITFPANSFILSFGKDVLAGLVIIFYCQIFVTISLSDAWEHLQGLHCDPGSYAASSFINGYLKKILAHSESLDSKSLSERIKDYKEKHEFRTDEFPLCKLFILIPSNCYTSPTVGQELQGPFQDLVKPRGNLEEEIKDRSGVRRRKFSNTVYSISLRKTANNVSRMSIVAEYATPVMTFYEAYKDHPNYDFLVKKFADSFYRSLVCDLKRHIELNKYIELIYYNSDETNEYLALVETLENLKVIPPGSGINGNESSIQHDIRKNLFEGDSPLKILNMDCQNNTKANNNHSCKHCVRS